MKLDTKNGYIDEIEKSQTNLNKLLMKAHEYNVRYELSINKPPTISENIKNIRMVVGIEIYDAMPIYKNDGNL